MNETVKMLKIQFDDSYTMLKSVAELCPEGLWSADNHGMPIWNHIIHSLMGSDFWFRLDYLSDHSPCLTIPEKLRDKLYRDEWCGEGDGSMTKEEIADCLKALEPKIDAFFGSLKDETLNQKIRDDMPFTYLSVICAQIRHIMCHVGMCQDAITAFGGEDIPWVAFGED
ncbi:MAG: hypothetical protein NC084_04430 [Bacteroides sp.]|nr:hypothetical protein [Eubacterium sp.]MCM1417891.1 hypothetical protein [Roseburia sp.]MCM1461945.1 hypothetical protein [Bacteroides sp.]